MIRLRKRSSRMSKLFALTIILSLLLCYGGTGIAFGGNDNDDTIVNRVYGGDNDGRNYSSIEVFEPEIDAVAECDWDIEKSVDPTAITLNDGNSFSEDATYTIQVTQDGFLYTIDGSVEVECDDTNDNPAEIDEVWIEIRDGGGYDGDLIYEEDLPEYSGDIIDNGDSAEFDFNIQFTDEDHSYGSDPLPDGLKFIVRVNIVNISPGKDPDDQPYKNQTDIEWERDCYETVTVVDDMEEVDDIDVTFSQDYNGGIWEDVTGDQDPITYTATFSGTVPGEYTVDNTATIEETEDSDDASVDITVEGEQDPDKGTIRVVKVVQDDQGNIIEEDDAEFGVQIDLWISFPHRNYHCSQRLLPMKGQYRLETTT